MIEWSREEVSAGQRSAELSGRGIGWSWNLIGANQCSASRLLDALSHRWVAPVDALPLLRKRVAKLLKGLGGYCCRACTGNPLYASQTKSTYGRKHFELCKIRLQLNGEASSLKPFPDRPRGMHRKRYLRMKARALELEQDLPAKLRRKPVDYRNLVYHLP